MKLPKVWKYCNQLASHARFTIVSSAARSLMYFSKDFCRCRQLLESDTIKFKNVC